MYFFFFINTWIMIFFTIISVLLILCLYVCFGVRFKTLKLVLKWNKKGNSIMLSDWQFKNLWLMNKTYLCWQSHFTGLTLALENMLLFHSYSSANLQLCAINFLGGKNTISCPQFVQCHNSVLQIICTLECSLERCLLVETQYM